MAIRVDPDLARRLIQLGGDKVTKCFNCGNCTAICPHSEAEDAFPRRQIRFAQVGWKDGLLASKNLWMCYYCGECSDTCPREAKPGAIMAAARRYAIASYDRTGIARLLYGSPAFNIAALLVLGALMTWYLCQGAGSLSGEFFENREAPLLGNIIEMPGEGYRGFMPFKQIHHLGMAVGIAAMIFMAIGIIDMVRRIWRTPIPGESGKGGSLVDAVKATIAELIGHRRFRQCASEKGEEHPWYLSRWFAHWAMLWGFAGLAVATAVDYLVKPVGMHVGLLFPPRLIGTIAGLAFLYGTGMAIWHRIEAKDSYAKDTTFTDWVFLSILFLLAVTGMALEILVYAAPATVIGNLILIVHVILALDLLLLMPFTKFAHAAYRTVAIFVHALRHGEAAAATELRKAA